MKQLINKNGKQHIKDRCLEERFIKTSRCEKINDSTLQNVAI